MADTTRATAPGREGGGKEQTILGLPIKTAVIVGAVAVVGGYLWIKYHSNQQASNQGPAPAAIVKQPTGTSRETITVWVRQHGGHRGRK